MKLPHERVESMVEHVTRGNSFNETAELTSTHRTSVSRLIQTPIESRMKYGFNPTNGRRKKYAPLRYGRAGGAFPTVRELSGIRMSNGPDSFNGTTRRVSKRVKLIKTKPKETRCPSYRRS